MKVKKIEERAEELLNYDSLFLERGVLWPDLKVSNIDSVQKERDRAFQIVKPEKEMKHLVNLSLMMLLEDGRRRGDGRKNWLVNIKDWTCSLSPNTGVNSRLFICCFFNNNIRTFII